MVRFTIPGKPQGKARPRFKPGGAVYTPKGTRAAEIGVGMLAKLAMHDARVPAPLEGNLSVSIEVTKRNKTKSTAKDGLWVGGTPDLDNIAKLICDGMNGIVYEDDRQIARLHVTRTWGREDKTVVTAQKL